MMLSTEFIPAKVDGSRRLMVVLHGLGDSTAGFEWMPSVLGLDWMNYLLVNAPDPYFGGFSWYDFAGDPKPGVERSRRMLIELLAEEERKGFPIGEMVLFGFSQGCLMTLDVGLRYPKLFAGLIGVSGYVFEPENLVRELSPVAKQQRVLMTHGTQDPIIPYAAVGQVVRQLKALGLKIEWREFVKAHTIAGEEEARVIRDFVVGGYPAG